MDSFSKYVRRLYKNVATRPAHPLHALNNFGPSPALRGDILRLRIRSSRTRYDFRAGMHTNCFQTPFLYFSEWFVNPFINQFVFTFPFKKKMSKKHSTMFLSILNHCFNHFSCSLKKGGKKNKAYIFFNYFFYG